MTRLIRNYFPGGTRDDGHPYQGKLIIHYDNYDRRLSTLTKLGELLISEAAQFDPPVTLTPDDITFEVYGGPSHKRQIGAEAFVPVGVTVPDTWFNWGGHDVVDAHYPTV